MENFITSGTYYRTDALSTTTYERITDDLWPCTYISVLKTHLEK